MTLKGRTNGFRRADWRPGFLALLAAPAALAGCGGWRDVEAPLRIVAVPTVTEHVEEAEAEGWYQAGRERGEAKRDFWWQPLRFHPYRTAIPADRDIIIRASDIPSGALHGAWQKLRDSTAAGGVAIADMPDIGRWEWVAMREPVHYFDVQFAAPAATPYHVWVRMRANRDDRDSDSIFLQFSDTVNELGEPVYRINSTSALQITLTPAPESRIYRWGWQDGWYLRPTRGIVYFGTTGPHVIRVQRKEDGAILDQIVLSPKRFLKKSPGFALNDNTVLPLAGEEEKQPQAVPDGQTEPVRKEEPKTGGAILGIEPIER